MALYMIGLGLWDAKDITVKGLEAVKRCDPVYLENYTSRLSCGIDELEKLYGKKVTLADREQVEINADDILDTAKDRDVAFLVVGDVLAATTHNDIRLRAEKKGIPVHIIHNASVLLAVGETGLELYKFGRVTSIPFKNSNVKSPVEAFNTNFKAGLHTLFLLDINRHEDSYMTINDAIAYLKREGVDNYIGVGCAGLGSDNPEIRVGLLKDLARERFTLSPQCMIIPGRMHFIEEETLKGFKKQII